jgi:uncharacterized protein (TIGR02099 family)
MVEADKPRTFLRALRIVAASLWYAVVGLIITAAVLLTVVRLWLPTAESYRAEIEQRISHQLGRPVHIGSMDARMLGLSPALVFEDVRVGSPTLAHFDEARVRFDLLATLRRREPVIGGLTVTGADLLLERQTDGALRIQGIPLSPAAKSGKGSGAVAAWLLSQGQLAIRDSRLRWRDYRLGKKTFTFDQVDVELLNSGRRHQLSGTLILPEEMGRSLHVAIDLEGDVSRPDGWHATAFVGATGVEPAPWIGPAAWRGVRLGAGEFDLKLWGEWRAGRLREVTGEFDGRGVHLQDGAGGEATFASLSSRLRWRRGGSRWELDLDRLVMSRDGAERPPIRLHLVRNDDGSGQLLVSDLWLGTFAPAARLGTLLDAVPRQAVATMNPAGHLRDIRLDLAASGQARIQARFQELSARPWRKIPGFSSISGWLVFTPDGGALVLDSRHATVDASRLFRTPLEADTLAGTLRLLRTAEGGWRVTTQQVAVRNADISGHVAMRMDIPAQGSPYLDLWGDFADGRAVAVPKYLPAHIMPPPAVRWLDQAFKGGTVVRGGLVYRGRFTDFPFRSHQGVFKVVFRARDVELDYHEGWPPLTGIDGRVTFEGVGLRIQAERGAIYSSDIRGTVASIANLRETVLQVDGRARGPAADALRILQETPLAAHLGGGFGTLSATGQSVTDINLSVPLGDKAKRRHNLSLDGQVALQQTGLAVRQSGIRLEGLAGTLKFTQDRVSAKDIEGKMFDRPVKLDVLTTKGARGELQTRVLAQGSTVAATAARALDIKLLGYLRGTFDWQATLTIPHRSDHGGAMVTVTSDLAGTAVELPPPLRQSSRERRRWTVSLWLSGKRRGETWFSIDRVLSGAFDLAGGGLRRGGLHFGPGSATLPKPKEILVTGAADGLDLAAWGGVLQGLVKDKPSGLDLPMLVIAMDRLHLAKLKGGKQGVGLNSSNLRRLPPMQVNIAQFAYGALEFSRLKFHTAMSPGLMRVDGIVLRGPHMNFSGRGRWKYGLNRSLTKLEAKAESDDFGKMMTRLGFASVIKKGDFQANGEFSWPGTPADVGLARINGELHVKVKNGTMEEVEPGAGRLLGLLSLDALPRRLLLDFSDLFGKGFRFESIKGDIRLDQGNAYTENMKMEGSSATLLVSGRTGLVKRDYDQLVTVIPNVSGGLPIAGGLAWGPQVGAVLLILQKVFHSKIDKVAQFQYRVTGTWQHPKITRLAKPQGGK